MTADGSNEIDCFQLTSSGAVFIGRITRGTMRPTGLAALSDSDNRQQLVVANNHGQDVVVYSGRCQNARVVRVLHDRHADPSGVAVSNNHDIFVANVRLFGSGNGDVRLYRPHDDYGVKLGDPKLDAIYAIAVKPDESEICIDGYSVGSVEQPAISCTHNMGKQWVLRAFRPTQPGGIAFDQSGYLVVNNGGAFIVDLGNGVSFPCPNGGVCSGIAFDSSYQHIFAGDVIRHQGYEMNWNPGPAGQVDITMPWSEPTHNRVISVQPVEGG